MRIDNYYKYSIRNTFIYYCVLLASSILFLSNNTLEGLILIVGYASISFLNSIVLWIKYKKDSLKMVPVLYSKISLKIGITLSITSMVIALPTVGLMYIDVIEVGTSIHNVLNRITAMAMFVGLGSIYANLDLINAFITYTDDDKTGNYYYSRFK